VAELLGVKEKAAEPPVARAKVAEPLGEEERAVVPAAAKVRGAEANAFFSLGGGLDFRSPVVSIRLPAG
jgi:hypothetical protein